ncbi:olfactory receptor 52L1-like, partial [Pleurodeles waltl]|uniref:olfactory receptor 52L1-like n=1 Tax=Pleurodeles waltl TaxID=8319 RepID=UPI003709819C
MDGQNITKVYHPSFTLLGIPGLEFSHFWIAFPFCLMYIIIILGNGTILLVVRSDASLQDPMHLFLCMLAVTDLTMCTTIMPKMLGIFWFQSNVIHFEACLFQMFLIHSSSIMESGVMVAMAFDRYIAICFPLRHVTILTHSIIGKIVLIVAIRGVLLIMPFPFMLEQLPFCENNIIAHSYCEHMAVVKLACSDTTINKIYGLFAALLVVGSDVVLIALSYYMILRSVLNLPTTEARLKSFNTCGSHLCAILLFYVPGLFTFLAHRFFHHVAPYIHILLANSYLMVPPLLNPLIYGMKTQTIRNPFMKLFRFSLP